MILKKVFLLCVSFTVILPSLACQPGGKFYGHCDKKLSKRDLRIGPNRNQQHKQAVWELTQTKRRQRGCGPEASQAMLAYYQTGASLSATQQPIQHDCQEEYCSCNSMPAARPLTAAILFTLLFMAQYATACRDNCVDRLAKARAHYPENEVANLWQCCVAYEFIEQHRGDYNAIIERAKQDKDKIGEISFPSIPDLNCPDPHNCHRRGWDHDDTNQDRSEGARGRTFFKQFEETLDELNNRITDYNKHLDAAQACNEAASLITEKGPYVDEIREYAQANKDKLGSEVIFPAAPALHCPPMDNWQQWRVEDAESVSQIAKTFLDTVNQKIDEIDFLVEYYNRKLDGVQECTEPEPLPRLFWIHLIKKLMGLLGL